jgi:hypothetical protein
MNHKEDFSIYIREASTDGSKRASSYIRAIELLDDILKRKAADLVGASSVWTLSSPTKIHQLYAFVLEQQRQGEAGIFQGETPVSYWRRCCITGLEIPQLCIASHIIRWADRTDTRMDPRNGLCLSATYDKAFENHLITLDEDYRLLVSPTIRDHYRNDHARELFEKREGQGIYLPNKPELRPLQQFLAEHRTKLVS